jgi:hypothetical protein
MITRTAAWLIGVCAVVIIACSGGSDNDNSATDRPTADTTSAHTGDSTFSGRVLKLSEQRLAAGPVVLDVQIALPYGYKLAPDAPTRLAWRSADPAVVTPDVAAEDVDFSKASFPYELAATAHAGSTVVTVDAYILYCETTSNLCRLENIRAQLPVTVGTDGKSRVKLRLPVEPPGGGY